MTETESAVESAQLAPHSEQSADSTSINAPAESARGGEQKRGAGGKFAQREPQRKNPNLAAIARNEVRKLRSETDADALADVQPKGQGSKPTKDPAPQSAATTDATKAAQSSPAATHVAKHLADAEKALERDGFSKEDIAGLSKERVLALGKKAADRQADTSRKLEEANRTKAAATPSDATKTDPGSPKPVTTAAAQEKDGAKQTASPDKADPFDAMVQEHFAKFAADEDFSKSLGGFSKALSTQLSNEMKEAISAARVELAQQIRTEAAQETEFERAVESLASDFPESSSVDGREALRDLFVTLAKEGKIKDIKNGVRASANALWADDKSKRDAAAAKEKASRDARKNGQPVTGSQGAGPNTKPPSLRSTALQEVRKARESQS